MTTPPSPHPTATPAHPATAPAQPAAAAKPPELAPLKAWAYPFASADGKSFTDPQAFFDVLSAAEDGFYPLGANGIWHGGIHFGAATGQKFKQDDGVRCIADGEVVAYRVDKAYPELDYSDNKKALYATGFTLVHHKLALPPKPPAAGAAATPAPAAPPADEVLNFFSLYMHQLDWKTYQANTKIKHPGFWTKQSARYRVGTRAKDHQTGGLEPSGTAWVSRFPTSRSTTDLTPAFAGAVDSFIQAIQAAGGSVTISATYRPAERAYLMHYAWCIAREGLSPTGIPTMAGVDIDWAHLDADGKSDNAAALQGAKDMVAGYAIAYEPSLTSRHTERRAIDMNISGVTGTSINDASGTAVDIGSTSALHTVGASYGVHKLISDPPHWSDDGH
jgi:hypothetical protein